ncbi:MAG: 16S rRNA (adenine(1518)-N(6)/adenine(1519)-N(6))-dimethyltransferase RsmA [Clostridiales bacterium]|nr:16S rRNA (adenine(1518)-N(6)/adenine(1519)-N(6))-dimethyltransferase RsmA [Clostridiales bacterium]
MNNLYDFDTLRAILSRHGFTFSKSLGQNFLIDGEICPEMAACSGVTESSGVIEIGAGVGVLTNELAKNAGRVVAFELDRRLLPVLSETLSEHENVKIINADALKTDLSALIDEEFPGMEVCVCANLPYYITSPLIMQLLESRLPLTNITVMVQKEAAERLCAEVGSRESGAVTVAVNYYAEASQLFFVPRTSFLPSPNVDSEVIQLKIRKKPPIEVSDEKAFFRMVRAAFSQRRKTARNSVSSGLGISRDDVTDALVKIGVKEDIRAEKLTMDDLAALFNALNGQL